MPGRWCTHRTEGWFIPGVSPIKTCDVHRQVILDLATGLRLQRDDRTRAARTEVYEFWPSDILESFERAGVPRRLPPPYLAGDTNSFSPVAGQAPRITSPATEIALTSDPSTAGVPLRAETESGVRQIYWFADKRFLGTCEPNAVLCWKPTPGVYQLTALDDHGRSGSRSITLR